MMIFHVTLNSTTYEVDATSASEAITIALDTYGTTNTDEPDGCLTGPTDGICVCAEFAGELIPETP